ncbi:uncharacterized protein V1516DRAFT_662531 [Lipomyces oligophaga]|uniref:uncharacterized protein n=1 Tax=Lipomyces oligophaga TaxID=45792 RepID=UPI0034CE0AD6
MHRTVSPVAAQQQFSVPKPSEIKFSHGRVPSSSSSSAGGAGSSYTAALVQQQYLQQQQLQQSQSNRNSPEAPPPIVALYLVRFDIRKGYVVDWYRTSSPAIPLDLIEFRSFPSGLHNSQTDVIYFMQGEFYSGVSVFLRQMTDNAAERYARMYSLGVLVPSGLIRRGRNTLGAGRMGRSWCHVNALRELVEDYSANPGNYSALDAYFSQYGLLSGIAQSPGASTSSGLPEPLIYNPPRRPFELSTAKLRSTPPTLSDNETDSFAAASFSGPNAPPILPASHPAYSLPSFLDTFGPLVFKIWKAALARERILIVGDMPIEQGCNFVYDIAILANIPQAIGQMLPIPAYRIRPLFAIGLYDIDYLQSLSKLSPAEEARQKRPSPFYGWIAYTTDKLLREKDGIFDVIVKLPPLEASISAAASISRPTSPLSTAGEPPMYYPVGAAGSATAETSSRILYPVITYSTHPKEHLRASIRDMRRFQTLEAQIGYSIDPRHRWFQKYCALTVQAEQVSLLERQMTASSSGESTIEYSGDLERRGRQPRTTEMMALLAAADDITAATNEDEIYNDDPELFFSTKTNLQTEQPSWRQLTWLGFLWWASAGEEARIDEEENVDVSAMLSNANGTNTSLNKLPGLIDKGTRPLLLDDSISRSSSVATTPMALNNEESFTYISPFQDLSQLDDPIVRRQVAVQQRQRLMSEEDNDEEEIEDPSAARMLYAAVESSKQVAIIGFFHRLTARVFTVLSNLIQEQNLVVQRVEYTPRRRKRTDLSSDPQPPDASATASSSSAASASSQPAVDPDLLSEVHQTLWISKNDMLGMGLDPWSDSDSRFVATIVLRWWGGQLEARRDNEFLNSVTFCC